MAWCLVKHRDSFTFNFKEETTTKTQAQLEEEYKMDHKGTGCE